MRHNSPPDARTVLAQLILSRWPRRISAPAAREGSAVAVARSLLPALAALSFGIANPSAQQAASKAAMAGADLRAVSRTLEALSTQVAPAIVQVFAVGYAPPSDAGEERSLLAQQRSTGSGVILDPDGYIVTN